MRMQRVSGIDTTQPPYGNPTTLRTRNNFVAAKDEIEELQDDKLDKAGGTMTGQIDFIPLQLVDGGTF
jgi:hypothetical protein